MMEPREMRKSFVIAALPVLAALLAVTAARAAPVTGERNGCRRRDAVGRRKRDAVIQPDSQR